MNLAIKTTIGLSIASALLFSVNIQAVETDTNSNAITHLDDVYQHSFKVGVAVNEDITMGKNGQQKQLVIDNFNTVTIENAMKAEIVNPAPGVYDFSAADAYVKFGQDNNMFIVGHTLVWHNQTPDFFFNNKDNQPNTSAQQLEVMRKHIKLVAGRYAGKVHAWDVVNEVIDNDGAYRPTTWVNGVGDGDTLVKAAFKYAAEYAPNTELYYNDFNAWRPEKRDSIVHMINMLKAEGIRIDGVGIQAHWGLNFPKTEYIAQAIDAYAAAGVKVMITELDIDVLPFTKEGQVFGQAFMHPQFQLEEFETYLDPYKAGLPDDVQQKLTARYVELFKLFNKKSAKIDRVTLWGLHDGMSWKNDYPIPARTNYPLLWDRQLQPKPALKALLNLQSK
jgi:endo-1,4-beta-xylanase